MNELKLSKKNVSFSLIRLICAKSVSGSRRLFAKIGAIADGRGLERNQKKTTTSGDPSGPGGHRRMQ